MIRMGRSSKPEPESPKPMSNPNPNYNAPAQPAPPNHQTIEDQYRQSVETSSTTSRAVTEAESLARSIKDGALSGYVGNGTVLTGETTFKSMLRIDGHLTGKINSETGTLIVGNQGMLDANVDVAIATIHGTVKGDVIATTRLELGRTAKVTGNITTPSLMIEQGAIFEGSCQMVQSRDDAEKRERQAVMPKTEPVAAKPAETTPAKKPETAGMTNGVDVGNKAVSA
jgi:cytoskeletal protein CcmA (bactofilin family)